jgi:hypothetical protein
MGLALTSLRSIQVQADNHMKPTQTFFWLNLLSCFTQRQGTFETYMSRMMTAPIVGSLAGNVLKRFRVDLDYPNAKLYLSGP